ncbi:hypothetical protein Belba_0780 [Belliella baltica DSM 15883]|uniref:Uncharacterized protein n=1 Tax=Belliella baltica (strain DSM 15883 / CIP 108006 / LMG 21964 / BA134) TaxID=866536 RepID=I3Z2G2_BELBD|nr:hypothetical protein [Belliella baltica]AFL83430.1 hypothetical protein Belba_0780 [Belliella baltica DSM 15883]
MKGKLIHIKLFVCILFFLWGPYLFKIKFPAFEIYPSLVMPVGSSVFHKQSENFVEYEITELLTINREQIDLKTVFPEIPSHYLMYFFQTDFGTVSYDRSLIVKGFLPLIKSNRFSIKDRDRAFIFLKRRLEDAGIYENQLIISRIIIKFDLQSKRVISKIIVDEKNIFIA